MSEFVKPPLPAPGDAYYLPGIGVMQCYVPSQLQARDAELLRAVADWLDEILWDSKSITRALRKAAEQ